MKRDEIILKLNELKKIADDSTISLYNEIISELNNTKNYGIVWDRVVKKEDIILECVDRIPVLALNNSKTILNEGTNNILIEGDNYHSLIAINMIAKESIDTIYIDPPYNTGKKDFKYNDRFVNEEDGYRHSKWLSFMKNRLELARQLLKEDGVMLISIDDREVAQLILLCYEIFGEKNVEKMIWQKVGDGNAAAGKMKATSRFRIEHEYILVCYKNKDKTVFKKYKDIPNFKNEYDNLDNDPRGPFKAGNMSKSEEKSNPEGKNYFTVISPDNKKSFTRQWSYSKEEIEQLIKENRIYWGKNGHSVPQVKIFINEERDTTPTSILINKGSASMGSNDLEEIFNIDESPFDNPKPIKLIKHLLSITSKDDAIIMDFFAGSGTTGQAVLELNKEDNGNRRFILCTNNEGNICEEITYPRLKTAITGKRDDGTVYSEGLPGTLYYMNTDYVNNSYNSDQAKYSLAGKIDVLLCIKENAFVLLNKNNYFTHYINKKENKHLFIYNDYYIEEEFNYFIDEIKNTTGHKVVYVFDTANYVDQTLFKGIDDIEIKSMPSKMYDVYSELIEEIKRN